MLKSRVKRYNVIKKIEDWIYTTATTAIATTYIAITTITTTTYYCYYYYFEQFKFMVFK